MLPLQQIAASSWFYRIVRNECKQSISAPQSRYRLMAFTGSDVLVGCVEWHAERP